MKINIEWKVTEVTKEELEKYLYLYPQTNYFIIDEYENNKNIN